MKRGGQHWLPSIFNDFFGSELMMRNNATAPSVNVFETEKEYFVEVAAPGMKKEDFMIDLNSDNNLCITMEKDCCCKKDGADCKCDDKKEEEKCKDDKCEKEKCCCEHDESKGRYLRREFAYSKFQQTLILPEDVDKKGINAAMHHGVLCILLPRIAPDNKPQNTQIIEIQ